MTGVTLLEREYLHAVCQFESIMVIECAWCKKVIGYKEGFGAEGPTSGICPTCSDEVKQHKF